MASVSQSAFRWPIGLIGVLSLCLTTCAPTSQEVVVRECIQDGNPLGYCECVAKGMRQALGTEHYAIFTDFTMLGGVDGTSPEDILKLMETYELSPAELAELRGSIATLSGQVHMQCAP